MRAEDLKFSDMLNLCKAGRILTSIIQSQQQWRYMVFHVSRPIFSKHTDGTCQMEAPQTFPLSAQATRPVLNTVASASGYMSHGVRDHELVLTEPGK